MDKTYEELTKELMLHLPCWHCGMDGEHRYSITHDAHAIIKAIKIKMWEEDKQNG